MIKDFFLLKNRFLLLIEITIFSFILITNQLIAQSHQQISLTSENDSYLSINNDGYYTNGLKLSYSWEQKKGDGVRYRFHEVQVGQLIYTAQFVGSLPEDIDRPITGYLYGSYHKTTYNQKQNVLRWGAELGFVGPPAFGKEMQGLVHKVMGIYKPQNWEYQMNGAWGVNTNLFWSPNITGFQNKKKIDMKPILSATAGSIFNQVTIGSGFLFGKFNSNNTSAFWNNHRGHLKSDRELFVYLLPSVSLKAYDATVQGGMFNKTPEKYDGSLNPVFFKAKLGAIYSGNKLSLGAATVYESKQSKTQNAGQYYGSLQLTYMW